MRHRITAFFGDAPLLFIGIVLGIAVVFRVGLDAARPASAEPASAEPASAGARAAAPATVVHEVTRVPTAPASPTAPPAGAPGAERASASTSAPGDARRSTRGAPHRRTPRTHGRR